MSYQSHIEPVQGDYGFYINMKLQNRKTQTVFDLTGANSAQLVVHDSSSRKFIGSCIIVDAPNGLCKYLVTSTDFLEVAVLYGDVIVTFSNRVETCLGLRINVKEKPPSS